MVAQDDEPTERVHFRCPRGLLRRIEDEARTEDRNRTGMMVRLMREALDARVGRDG